MFKGHGKTTDSYQPGNVGTKYIMVFECPTANEKREQRPVVGATGFNLCRLLELVRNHDNFMRNAFASLRKCEVRIANASTHEHESGDKVEQTELEENASQLLKYMAGCKYAFLFGLNAEKGFQLATNGNDHEFSKIIAVYHLSPYGIQHIRIAGKGRMGSSEWTLPRLRVIAKYLCSKIRDRSKIRFTIDDFRKYLDDNGFTN